MSEETPNQSEERLQRYAKERRAQGGDFALHPATRRMLQGEVARTFGVKESAAKSRGLFSWLNRGRTYRHRRDGGGGHHRLVGFVEQPDRSARDAVRARGDADEEI